MLWGWTLIIGLTLFFFQAGHRPLGTLDAAASMGWGKGRRFPHAQDPEQEGQPHPCEPGDFRKGPEAVVHLPCTSPGAGRRWDLPVPLVPVSSLAVGPKMGSTSPLQGFPHRSALSAGCWHRVTPRHTTPRTGSP